MKRWVEVNFVIKYLIHQALVLKRYFLLLVDLFFQLSSLVFELRLCHLALVIICLFEPLCLNKFRSDMIWWSLIINFTVIDTHCGMVQSNKVISVTVVILRKVIDWSSNRHFVLSKAFNQIILVKHNRPWRLMELTAVIKVPTHVDFIATNIVGSWRVFDIL